MSPNPPATSSLGPGKGSPDSPPVGSTKLVIAAAVLALVAIVLVNVYVEYVKRTSEEGEIVKYRLLTTLRPGERLREGDIKEVRLPKRYEEAFANYLSKEEKDARLGSMVLRQGNQNEFLSGAMFTQPDESTLDMAIDKGMRLYALPINSRTTIGGLRPGMVVDIEAPFRGSGAIPLVMPVMEKVKIVLVGNVSTVDERGGSASRITSFQTIGIQVTPQAATKLSMIDRLALGPFELHLRNRADEANVKILNPDDQTGINPAVLDMLPTAPGATRTGLN